MRILNYILIIFCLLQISCKNETVVDNTHYYKTTKIFAQENNGPNKLYSLEKFDSLGKSKELIRYNYDDELVNSVRRIYYDSLDHPTVIKICYFNSNKYHLTLIFQSFDTASLLIKKEIIMDYPFDTICQFYEYSHDRKLIRSRNIQKNNTDKFGRKTKVEFVEEYIYYNDSLCKTYISNNDGLKRRISDTIIYSKDQKLIRSYNGLPDVFDTKTTYYNNGLITRAIDSSSEENYFYDSNSRLVKRERIDYDTGDVIYPGQPRYSRSTFTYFYE